MLKLRIDSGVEKVDLSAYTKYTDFGPWDSYFPSTPGVNHHQLLSYLSSQLDKGSLCVDAGTLVGQSAIALASNPDINVITVDTQDIAPRGRPTYKDLPNITFLNSSCLVSIDSFTSAKIIFLDIDPHDGVNEQKFLDMLLARVYRGVLICDDILLPNMKSFWKNITLKKFDVSVPYGHWSGTGIVVFDSNTIDVVLDYK